MLKVQVLINGKWLFVKGRVKGSAYPETGERCYMALHSSSIGYMRSCYPDLVFRRYDTKTGEVKER